MLQNVRMSVGRTWRYQRADGAAAVSRDLTGFRQQIDHLKGRAPVAEAFRLPWPDYPSTMWQHLFGGSYQNTASPTLVATLLPLLFDGEFDVASAGCRPRARFEALLHPFALTTVVHLELTGPEPWPDDDDAAALLDTLWRSPLAGGAQVRDGVGLERLPPRSTTDQSGQPATHQPAGRFVVLSALHQEAADPAALAYRLASHYLKASVDAGQPLNTDGGAIAATDDRVAFVLPRALPRAGTRATCLHHNLTTLLAYVQNLAVLTPATPTPATEWFQGRAGALLNHLYRRAPLPETGSIYKARLPQLWLDHRGLPGAVNAVTAGLIPPLPALPT